MVQRQPGDAVVVVEHDADARWGFAGEVAKHGFERIAKAMGFDDFEDNVAVGDIAVAHKEERVADQPRRFEPGVVPVAHGDVRVCQRIPDNLGGGTDIQNDGA